MSNTSSKHKTVSELSGSKLYFAVTICVFCQVIAMAGEPRKLSSFNGDFGTLVAAVLPYLDLFVRPLALEARVRECVSFAQRLKTLWADP